MSSTMQETIIHSWNIDGKMPQDFEGQKWQYVGVIFGDGEQGERWFHANCDSMANEFGFCLLCGEEGPGA